MKLKIESEILKFQKTIKLDSGKKIESCEIAFKTYGKLNKEKTNAILVCHALSGDQFCAGINPNTKKRLVECFNWSWKSN